MSSLHSLYSPCVTGGKKRKRIIMLHAVLSCQSAVLAASHYGIAETLSKTLSLPPLDYGEVLSRVCPTTHEL